MGDEQILAQALQEAKKLTQHYSAFKDASDTIKSAMGVARRLEAKKQELVQVQQSVSNEAAKVTKLKEDAAALVERTKEQLQAIKKEGQVQMADQRKRYREEITSFEGQLEKVKKEIAEAKDVWNKELQALRKEKASLEKQSESVLDSIRKAREQVDSVANRIAG